MLALSVDISSNRSGLLVGFGRECAAECHTYPMQPLAAWVARSREGDMSAFRLLYEQTRPALHNVIARLTDNEDDASEIVQMAFVKAWQNIHELREDAAFSGWVRRIAMNLLRDHWRRSNRFEDIPDDDAPGALEDQSPDTTELLVSAEQMAHLNEAVSALPELFRLPVILHYLDDRSVEEVSEILDLPRGTVLSRLSRARARLKEYLLRRKDGAS